MHRLAAVAHNKLRASLTSLGILFGVASVIAMLAIGNGAEQEILEQMKMLGANNIIITPIIEQKEGEAPVTRFSGWMFASSPALSAMEHPVYDLWVLDCTGTPEAEQQPAPQQQDESGAAPADSATPSN